MATVTIVRTTSASQINSLLTQASASNIYLTQASASTNYLTQASASTNYLTQASASSTYAPIIPTVPTSFRNAFTNGNFSIDQRNNSAAQTITSGSPLAYTADRWFAYSYGSNISGQRFPIDQYSTRYVYKFTSFSPNHSFTQFGQRIESQNSFHLAGKTATLSVDLAKSHGGSIGWYAYYANTKDSFGSISSPTKTYFANGNWSDIGQNFSRYTTNISIPAEAVNGIEIYFIFNNLSTFQEVLFRDIQLEVGSTATPFENRPTELELSLCQRYYCSSVSNDSNYFHNSYLASPNSGFNEAVSVSFPTRMRVVPTLTVSFTNFDNATNGGQAITVDGFEQYFRCGNASFPYAGWRASYVATAEL